MFDSEPQTHRLKKLGQLCVDMPYEYASSNHALMSRR
jgi:hypothetical protein